MSDTEQLIPLSSLTRLDLRPGDTLVVTAPDDRPMTVHALAAALTERMAAWHPGVHVLVVPRGTDAAVLTRAERS